MSKSGKVVLGALAAASLLGSAGTALAATTETSQETATATVDQQESSASVENGVVNVANVEGDFTFTQDAVTSNEKIASVFRTAAQSFCAAAPWYSADQQGINIAVGGDVPNGYTANLSEMSDEGESATQLMGCACSANIAGGGAAVNAEVSGVPIATLLEKAGA